MKNILISFCLLAFAACRTTDSGSDLKFYGADNQSGTMSYASYIEVALPEGVVTNDDVMKGSVKAQMNDIIMRQIQHIFGAFTEHPGFKRNPGIIQAKGTPIITSAEVDAAKGTVRVNYVYKDKVVFKQKRMKDGPTKIEFVLPKDPTRIYEKGFVTNSSVNSCTDEHYNSEEDFWYFWNPKRDGCPITSKDLVKISADLIPIPNTKLTFPYYDKILGDNGNGKKLKIVYLVGVDENFKAGDLGRQTFKEAIGLLEQHGYKLEPRGTARKKLFTFVTPEYEVELEMSLVNPASDSFVQTAALGLETSDVFIYDGHSGLGGYLSMDRFQEVLGRSLSLPLNKSQIFYFNGCSTFSYYNGDYFDLKKTPEDLEGRTHLDVLTTSIGATFEIGARHDIELITSITSGKRPSWQTILDNIYRVDPRLSALTHVNGDEDNPSSAR